METHTVTKCQLCSGPLIEIFDYGNLPLANGLKNTREEALFAPRYAQKLLYCENCLLGHLGLSVDPEVLFSDYVYKSSISETFREHCEALMKTIVSACDGVPKTLLDIAGNDGALMKEFLKNRGARGFVYDVAQNDEPGDYVKIKKLWSAENARDFVNQHGRMDVITAQNVVGHVPDIKDFFIGVRYAIADDGLFIVEIPSFVELLRTTAFDTVYHEHVLYWTETAMRRLAAQAGFVLKKTEHLPIHCGSFRFFLTPGIQRNLETVPLEAQFFSTAVRSFREDVSHKLRAVSQILKYAPLNIVVVTASAKSCVFLNLLSGYFPFNHIVDDTPEKQGKFSPGSGIEILPFTPQNVRTADVALILSRNLIGPMSDRLNRLGFRGVIVAP